uniref:Uncharacterized protein n=2 Tax=unclassified Caudoviricetes TaxID=2788787 RepID=A0A8S5M3C4_9CAUD|nr:MAG TPA: hypothetical protein [Siphoviridae sp. ctQJR51]DAD76730.1 MAG TPA: hypothetical protein [Siphoviridae sp. ctQJR51]DAF96535.1 MAG TPA: hypothetical protein [Siphoviridae sp. ctHj524]DAF96562.1 MAG TPA: hypothetical protein [Siphoviridae sp. ctHj524]
MRPKEGAKPRGLRTPRNGTASPKPATARKAGVGRKEGSAKRNEGRGQPRSGSASPKPATA